MAGITLILDTKPTQPVAVPVSFEPDEFCLCDFVCDYEEKVFSDDGTDDFKKDFSDFLYRKVSPTDSVEIELFRYGNKVAVINDDTYGQYFDFPERLYIGWLADWTKIFNAFSGGQYQVKTTAIILGTTIVFESRFFRLNAFDEYLADRTVKIETIQNGNIVGSEFDLTGLEWKTSLRIPGTFGKMNASLESDIYKDSSYRIVQNRDEVIREYELSGELIPETLYTRLSTYEFIANDIFMTSYDLLQGENYQKFPVVLETFNDTDYKNNTRMNFTAAFRDRQQNIIKRNF